MKYKGHPVEQLEAFHEQRGHGAVKIHVKLPQTATTSPGPSTWGLPNGVYTIEGPRGHRTFRISTILEPGRNTGSSAGVDRQPRSDQEDTFRHRHHGKRVLELLTGPDNTSNYKGLAWYATPKPIDMYQKFKEKVPFDVAITQANSGIGHLWKFGIKNEVLVNTFAKLVERAGVLDGYTVHFAKHCLKCNRLLTTPESIERGIGPVCAAGGWD